MRARDLIAALDDFAIDEEMTPLDNLSGQFKRGLPGLAFAWGSRLSRRAGTRVVARLAQIVQTGAQ